MNDEMHILITNTGDLKRVTWHQFVRHAPALSLVHPSRYMDILREVKQVDQKMRLLETARKLQERHAA